MGMQKIGICEPDLFPQEALIKLKKIGEVELLEDKHLLNGFIKDKNIIFTRINFYIDNSVLILAPSLRIICTPTTGLTHIDLPLLEKRNIKLISLTGAVDFLEKVPATAEHTVGLIISVLRKYPFAARAQHSGDFARELYLGRDLQSLTVGLIGYGRLGKLVSNLLTNFGCGLISYDVNFLNCQITGQPITKSELIENSDVIVLLASYKPGGDVILTEEDLLKMENKILINVSRGELIDEESLYNLAKNDYFAGLAIDVIRDEKSKSVWNRWIRLCQDRGRNVLVTPHIGGYTSDSLKRAEIFLVDLLMKTINDETQRV